MCIRIPIRYASCMQLVCMCIPRIPFICSLYSVYIPQKHNIFPSDGNHVMGIVFRYGYVENIWLWCCCYSFQIPSWCRLMQRRCKWYSHTRCRSYCIRFVFRLYAVVIYMVCPFDSLPIRLLCKTDSRCPYYICSSYANLILFWWPSYAVDMQCLCISYVNRIPM